MKTTGVNLTRLCQIYKKDSECVDVILVSTDLEGLIEQAKKGDKDAAKELLGLGSSYLASDVFGSMPLELRRYLCRALASISLGEKAHKAVNLSRNGRGRGNHRTNLRLAHWMYKAMRNDGKTYEDASLDICDEIAERIGKHETVFGFYSAPSEKTLQGIYDKHLQEIEAIYDEVRKTRASLKTQ
jgi:hypothetical protein